VNYDNSLVVTIRVTCYAWAPSSGDHLFTCGVIYRPPTDMRNVDIIAFVQDLRSSRMQLLAPCKSCGHTHAW